MFSYYIRTHWHTRSRWLFLLIITIVWFFYDRNLTTTPVVTADTLFYVNATYGTDFASAEDAAARLPAFMLDRFFGFAYPRFVNAGAWLLLLLPGLLLAQPLGTGSAQLPLVNGHSRVKHCLFLAGSFYLVVIALQGIQLLLHLCNMGIDCIRIMDWSTFLLAFLVQSISLCGFVSITTIFAFTTQSFFPTVLLSLLYLALMVLHILPVTMVKIDWTQPPSTASICLEMIYAICKAALATVIACIIYSRRDIRKV